MSENAIFEEDKGEQNVREEGQEGAESSQEGSQEGSQEAGSSETGEESSEANQGEESAAAESEQGDLSASDAGAEEGEAEEEEAEGSEGAEEKLKPEDYDLAVPKDSRLGEAHRDEIAEYASKQGLSKDQAQAQLERETALINDSISNARKIVEEETQKALEEVSNQWLEDFKNDPVYGGEKASESAELAKRFQEAYFPQDVREWLEETGMGNHPGAVKAFVNIARDLGIGDDNFASGTARTPQKKNDSELFYGPKKQ